MHWRLSPARGDSEWMEGDVLGPLYRRRHGARRKERGDEGEEDPKDEERRGVPPSPDVWFPREGDLCQ